MHIGFLTELSLKTCCLNRDSNHIRQTSHAVAYETPQSLQYISLIGGKGITKFFLDWTLTRKWFWKQKNRSPIFVCYCMELPVLKHLLHFKCSYKDYLIWCNLFSFTLFWLHLLFTYYLLHNFCLWSLNFCSLHFIILHANSFHLLNTCNTVISHGAIIWNFASCSIGNCLQAVQLFIMEMA